MGAPCSPDKAVMIEKDCIVDEFGLAAGKSFIVILEGSLYSLAGLSITPFAVVPDGIT